MTHSNETIERTSRLSAFMDRLERWLWSGPQHELERLSEAEAERIARDIGVSMGELERMTRSRSDGQLLYQRLAKLGLDGETVRQQGYLRDLQRTCSLCGSQDVCRHDLSERPESGDWERYCPNVDVLKSLEATTHGERTAAGSEAAIKPAKAD